MAKPEWGIKHECPNCSARFYDLTKPSPLTCPSCSYGFATDVLHRVRKTKLTKDDSDDDQDGIEDDIDDTEANDIVDDSDNLLLHDDEDEENIVADTSDVNTLDEDDMFPDEDTDINTEELPEELLSDDDDIDADIDLEAEDKIKSK